MKLSAPKGIVFLISLILIIVGLLIHINVLRIADLPAYWITFAGAALLTIGCLFKGI